MPPSSQRLSGPGRGAKVRRSGGFTLTELAVVLTVIAVLAGLAVPSLGWIGSARRNVAGTRVRAAIAFAQEWSLGSGDRCWAEVDAGTDRLTVFVEDRANPGQANRQNMKDPLTRAPMVIQLGADGVGIDAVDFEGTGELSFDGEGAPGDASGLPLTRDGTVVLSGGITVRVSRGTGLVTID